MNEKAPCDRDEWVALRDEIWACRETTDVARRYFRSTAERYRRREVALTIASSLAQSGGVVAVFDAAPFLALALTVVAGAITSVGLATRYV